ncbi:hypothetical protein LOK49_LG04G01497 [Camellia lanceoleosa]|uniref:Uncharacterized protein n=1 Tax=Camellia lanceoleosa TaxID=1840588 RepID=A0ACC0I107_9ERIC|nr:hypothetical protein LOK49_LG04G01497 [Camellia lanceoleosa]
METAIGQAHNSGCNGDDNIHGSWLFVGCVMIISIVHHLIDDTWQQKGCKVTGDTWQGSRDGDVSMRNGGGSSGYGQFRHREWKAK